MYLKMENRSKKGKKEKKCDKRETKGKMPETTYKNKPTRKVLKPTYRNIQNPLSGAIVLGWSTSLMPEARHSPGAYWRGVTQGTVYGLIIIYNMGASHMTLY